MIKHKSGAQKRKERVIRERLRCKGQQRLESFGTIRRERERKRSCEDVPDQETANKVLNVSESSPAKSLTLTLNPCGS